MGCALAVVKALAIAVARAIAMAVAKAVAKAVALALAATVAGMGVAGPARPLARMDARVFASRVAKTVARALVTIRTKVVVMHAGAGAKTRTTQEHAVAVATGRAPVIVRWSAVVLAQEAA